MKTSHVVLAAAAALVSTAGFARCDIKNETKYSFEVESGHTSNQQVGSNTSTSIDAGKIVAKSKDGKSFSGSCKDGDKLLVKETGGVVVLSVK